MNRRSSLRTPSQLEASLSTDGTKYPASILNISERGLHLIASPYHDPGILDGTVPVRITIDLSEGGTVKVRGRLVWSKAFLDHRSTRRVGVELIDPPSGFRSLHRRLNFEARNDVAHSAIAIIGMACYYPGARNLAQFWENILARRREFRRIPEQRLPLAEYFDPDPATPDKTYASKAAVIDGFELDWVKLGIPKPVIEATDIAHWLALHVALQALEDGGYDLERMPSDRTGVIVGNTLTGEHSRSKNMRLRWPYVRRALKAAAKKKGLPPRLIDDLSVEMESYYKSVFAPVTEDTLAGNLSNTIAGRICNYLDLRGGGYTVDGACSSSLLAVATAGNSLSTGKLDIVVAGGVDISLDTFELVGFAKANALAREEMSVYDRRASGFIPGEGSGFVVLKRLEDARAHGNRIYAVLRGWGISSDGKGSITAPKSQTQALAIRRAYTRAGYGIGDIDFMEGHGTGTPAGDKAELEGIALAMNEERAGPLRSSGITSLKSIIGHTKAASGIGGLIKAVMAVNRRVLPPTAGCVEPNSVFRDKALSVYPILQGEVRRPEDTLRASVSGMGFGGINCHVTIESADPADAGLEPSIGERELLSSFQETEIFLLSAGTIQELLERSRFVARLSDGISQGELVDLACRLSSELLSGAPLRAAVVAATPEGLLENIGVLQKLLSEEGPGPGQVRFGARRDVWCGHARGTPRVGFLFPGQGSQHLNMGRVIVERHPWARKLLRRADGWLQKKGFEGLSDILYRSVERAIREEQVTEWKDLLTRSETAQPAICLASLFWLRYLARLGITPAAAGGHSLGELTAFHAAGALVEEELLCFAALRGREMSASDGPPGVMASFACHRERLESILKRLDGYAVVANINSPVQTVLSGDKAAIDEAVRLASDMGIACGLLPVANAFHSRYVAGASEQLRQQASLPETGGQMKIPLYSSMSGKRVSPGAVLRDHFASQVISAVDFQSMVQNMKNDCDIFLEVGPGRVLSGLVQSTLGDEGPMCFPVEARANDDRSLNRFLCRYYVGGGEVDWTALYEKRLVRPFVPVEEKLFIDNPCERPFPPGLEDAALPQTLSPVEPGSALSPDPTEADGLFTAKQVAFMRTLVQSELGRTAGGSARAGDEAPLGRTPTHSPKDTDAAKESRPPSSVGQIDPDFLLELASEATGFPREKLAMEHRLLDDLNLDSIKAGQLVARALKEHGLEGTLDPTTMANSSLDEILATMTQHTAAVPDAAVASPTVEDIKAPAAPFLSQERGWVRCFRVSWQKQDLSSTVDGGGKRVVVVSDNPGQGRSTELAHLLTTTNFTVTESGFDDIEAFAGGRADESFSVVFQMPEKDEAGLLTPLQIRAMARRLHVIGSTVAAHGGKGRGNACVVIQVGDGDPFLDDGISSLESRGSAAFCASLHLENPGEAIKPLQFQRGCDPERLAESVARELRNDQASAIVSYDESFTRRVLTLVPSPASTYGERDISWSEKDTVLVTGGAKGITAECALAFAKKTGAKLALVGRTVLIDEDKEIQNALGKFRDVGIRYRYYACDIADERSVVDLRRRIEQDLGSITGVIHGAAVNRPRRAEQVPVESALEEIAPKLLGALNICRVLADKPPKLFVGLSSIIGVSGMKGNAWYAFSNEMLNLLLQRNEKVTGTTQAQSIAYSIWSGAGMGLRMGSIDTLLGMGIYPIPPEQGVERFMQLVGKDPGARQIVVSSRLAGIDTLHKEPPPEMEGARFLEEVLFFEKGVEIEARAQLTLQKDPYLEDHVFRGSHLFPAVFGLQAMAQAVKSVTGAVRIDYLRIEDIQLTRPITVVPGETTEISVRAVVDESADGDEMVRVKAGIAVDQTGFSVNHFEAVFVIADRPLKQRVTVEIPATPLDIVPGEDLYGGILFQGERFQRIAAVNILQEGRCVFESVRDLEDDPFFNDTLLQSIQILLPELSALPVAIKRWERFPASPAEQGTERVEVKIIAREGDLIDADVTAFDSDGAVVERLHGYRVKVVDRRKHAPRVRDLAEPDDWDEGVLNEKIRAGCEAVQAAAPIAAVANRSGIHNLSRKERHALEEGLFSRAYANLRIEHEDLPEAASIRWENGRRPLVDEDGRIGVSISHDDRLCVCLVGPGAQGCDIERVVHRDEEEWKSLLGSQREELLNEVMAKDGSKDMAASRIWSAVEALRKATNMKVSELRAGEQSGEFLVFESANHRIVTFPVTPLRGGQRIFAVAVEGRATSRERSTEVEWGTVAPEGPHGQSVFTHRFPVTFRETTMVNGSLHFTNYYHWMGRARELVLQPIGKRIASAFSRREYLVTNHSKTRIVEEVVSHDTIEAKIWLDRMFGPFGSSFALKFEWRRLLPDGSARLAASGEQQSSWVSISEAGSVEPIKPPEFFLEHLEKHGFLPGPGKEEPETEPGLALGKVLREENPLDDSGLLEERTFETSTENSSFIQGIYFSHYFTWQGQVRDGYFFSIDQERFRAMDRKGRLVCLRSGITHLREAVPFDTIRVTMKLKKLYDCGCDLYFDFYRRLSRGGWEKLAFGEHVLAWAGVDDEGRYVPGNLPGVFLKVLRGETGQGLGQDR